MLWDDHIFGTYKGSDYKDYITAEQIEEFNIKELFPHKIVKNLIWLNLKLKHETMHCTLIVVFSR
jgi:hypothetical protein